MSINLGTFDFYGQDFSMVRGQTMFLLKERNSGTIFVFRATDLLADRDLIASLPISCKKAAQYEVERQERRRQRHYESQQRAANNGYASAV